MKKDRRSFPSRLPDTVEEDLRTFFTERPEVILVYLFGSFLTRDERPYHDIDVAVYVLPEQLERLNREKPYGYEAFLISNLGRLLKSNCADLVVLNSAPPFSSARSFPRGSSSFAGPSRSAFISKSMH